MTTTKTDRMVHAKGKVDTPESPITRVEIVRYDREGRWYREEFAGSEYVRRQRLGTVNEAVRAAVNIEENGGEIRLDQPGGNRFDYMVRSARERKARGR